MVSTSVNFVRRHAGQCYLTRAGGRCETTGGASLVCCGCARRFALPCPALLAPYEPPVPDPETRPAVEQLLFEMDRCGVDEAVLVTARIDHNPDNNDYVPECVRRYPERLYQFADVDCMWTPTYHTPGAANRLANAVRTYG